MQLNSVGEHSRTLAQARLLPLGDKVVVERAVSQNTHPSSRAPDDLVSVRALAAPTRREIEALAEIFDQYRAHYGEASDAFRSASWLDENLSRSREPGPIALSSVSSPLAPASPLFQGGGGVLPRAPVLREPLCLALQQG
jgi:hypothetical protein